MAEEVSAEDNAKKGFDLSNLGMGAWIGVACAALVIGLLVGTFLLGGGSTGGALEKATVTEQELDTAVASYTYNGQKVDVTAREVIEATSSLDASKDEDGNYAVPSADSILQHVRNQISMSEADARGITVSDEDLSSYAEQYLGSSDFESIATTYGMTEDAVKTTLTNQLKFDKLREEVVSAEAPTMPEAPPEAPATEESAEGEEGEQAEGEESEEAEDPNKVVKPEYLDYIISLVGDEWDAEKGEWVSTDGTYASQLSGYEITKDGASYEAAQTAYYIAYQEYSTAQTELSTQWNDFVNDLYSKASIAIYTLRA